MKGGTSVTLSVVHSEYDLPLIANLKDLPQIPIRIDPVAQQQEARRDVARDGGPRRKTHHFSPKLGKLADAAVRAHDDLPLIPG